MRGQRRNILQKKELLNNSLRKLELSYTCNANWLLLDTTSPLTLR